MERSIPLIESKKELKIKSWLYTIDKCMKKRNEYLILQHDEALEYYLFCVYCVCYGSDLRSRLSNKGIKIKQAVNIRRTISEHIDSLAHQKCHQEHFRDKKEVDNRLTSEYERIQNNRFIVNEVIETLVHLITNSRYFHFFKLIIISI